MSLLTVISLGQKDIFNENNSRRWWAKACVCVQTSNVCRTVKLRSQWNRRGHFSHECVEQMSCNRPPWPVAGLWKEELHSGPPLEVMGRGGSRCSGLKVAMMIHFGGFSPFAMPANISTFHFIGSSVFLFLQQTLRWFMEIPLPCAWRNCISLTVLSLS